MSQPRRDGRSEEGEETKQAERPRGIGSGFREKSLGKLGDLEMLGRLGRYMRPYGATFVACLLLLPLISALKLVQPYLLGVAIDTVLIGQGGWPQLWKLAAGFGGALLGQAGLEYVQVYLMQRAGQHALYDLRNDLFVHVQSLSVSFFHKNPVGRLMTRMTTDVDSLQEAISSGMVTMVGDLFTLVGIVAILLALDWKLALVSFIALPPLLVSTAFFRRFLRQAFREIRVKIARLNAYLQESITGMSVIQFFVRENVSAAEYRAINQDYRDANYRSIRYDALLYSTVSMIADMTIGGIVLYGSAQVIGQAVTIGVLVTFIEYMRKFFVPIRDLAQKYNLLQSAIASSERIFELLDTQERIPNPAAPRRLEGAAGMTIEFREVWFAYNDEEWILRGVSFCIEPGEKVALVGHTGAGKSTIMNLLLRLYDVTRGAIVIGGVDIRELDVHQWRAHFAVVLQDSFLFRGTLGQNVSLGRSVSTEELEETAKLVHLDRFLGRYEARWEHVIRERGANLSAGERQLVSFARALAHEPNVLVLDEATANVDTETEAIIQDALEVLLSHQTSLIVAHRLSTIRKADRILVLQRGELIEEGSHQELLGQGGHYANLYTLQFDAGQG